MSDDEELSEAVKRLFMMIRAGRAVLTEGVPELRAAIAAVRFSEDGEPVMDTVTPLVRAAARGVAATESGRLEHPSEWEERFSALEGVLPERVPIDEGILEEATQSGDHRRLAFNLYKEAVGLVLLCAGAVVGTQARELVLDRNRAIVAALLARVAKFMTAVLRLSSDGGFGEVALALNRSILESRTDIVYLCHDNTPERFDRYVKDGLAAERALYDRVTENVWRRGHSLPIEDRLLGGVNDIFRMSGVAIEEVEPGRRSLDLASRLKEVGREDEYLFIQKIPSVTVHGTWLDLLHHHLKEVDGGFRVRFEQTPADVRGLIPTGLLVLDALRAFCDRHLSAAPEVTLLAERIEDLGRRMHQVDRSHEAWFRSRGRRAHTVDDGQASGSEDAGIANGAERDGH